MKYVMTKREVNVSSPEQRDQPRQQYPNGGYIKTKKFSILTPAGQFKRSLKTIAEGVGVIYGHEMKQLFKNRKRNHIFSPHIG